MLYLPIALATALLTNQCTITIDDHRDKAKDPMIAIQGAMEDTIVDFGWRAFLDPFVICNLHHLVLPSNKPTLTTFAENCKRKMNPDRK